MSPRRPGRRATSTGTTGADDVEPGDDVADADATARGVRRGGPRAGGGLRRGDRVHAEEKELEARARSATTSSSASTGARPRSTSSATARWWFGISAIIILLGIISLSTRGLNEGIDFKGGSPGWSPRQTLTVAQATAAAESAGVTSPTVVQLTDQLNHIRSRSRSPPTSTTKSTAAQRQHRREQRAGRPWPRRPTPAPDNVNFNDVGPTWGGQVTDKAIEALIMFFIAGGHLHLGPVRVQDGGGRHRGRAPRHPGHGGHLLAGRLSGDPGHGGGRAHRARLFALRHRGGLRPDRRELQGPRRLGPHHLLGHGQPVDEPDPGPVDQHLAGGHHPGAVGTGGRARSSWAPPPCRTSVWPWSSV